MKRKIKLNFLSELTSETEPKHTTFLMKNYGLSRPKAKRLYFDKKTARKVCSKKITHRLITKVDQFYKRGDISIVDPNVKKASKKKGARRHRVTTPS